MKTQDGWMWAACFVAILSIGIAFLVPTILLRHLELERSRMETIRAGGSWEESPAKECSMEEFRLGMLAQSIEYGEDAVQEEIKRYQTMVSDEAPLNALQLQEQIIAERKNGVESLKSQYRQTMEAVYNGKWESGANRYQCEPIAGVDLPAHR